MPPAPTGSSRLWKSSTLRAATTSSSTSRATSRPSIPRAIAARSCPWPTRRSTSRPWCADPSRRRADESERGQDGRQRHCSETRFRALYFTRATAPYGDGPLYHHIGLYAYRRKALQRFVSLPPSPLEMRERLEQLRALEAGMRIDAILVDDVPLGVDTPEDLERARAIIAARRTP